MAIIARNLSKSFDGGRTFALKDVNVEVTPGEFIAIIGLSGAGRDHRVAPPAGSLCRDGAGL